MRQSRSCCRKDTLWLITEPRSHFVVSALHLLVGEFEFCLARLVRCDLRDRRTAPIFPCKMFFDLLPARTRSVQILAGLTLNFGWPLFPCSIS